MNTVQDPWNRPKTPAEELSRLYTGMDKAPKMPRTDHQQKRRDKRIGRVGTALVGATIVVGGGAYVGNHATDAVEQQTIMPTKAQQESVQRALPAKAAAEQKNAAQISADTPHENMTVTELKPNTYMAQPNDSLTKIIGHNLVDANGMAFEGDYEPILYDLNRQVRAMPDHRLDPNDVLTSPAGYQFTQIDTHPPKE